MIVRLDSARTGAYRRSHASNVCTLASPPVHSDLLLALYIYIGGELAGQPWALLYWVLGHRRVSKPLGSCSVVLESREGRNQGWVWMRRGTVLWNQDWFLAEPLSWAGNAPGAADREFKGISGSPAALTSDHSWWNWLPLPLRNKVTCSDPSWAQPWALGRMCLCTWKGSVLPSWAAGLLVPPEKQQLWNEAVNFTGDKEKKNYFLYIQYFSAFGIISYIYIQYSVNWYNYFPLVSGQELRNPVKVQ